MMTRTCNPFYTATLALFLLFRLAHAAPVPLTKNVPVALDKIRRNNPSVLPMTGPWKFKPERGIMTPVGYRPASAKKAAMASSSKQG